MWVPAGAVYVMAGLVTFVRWVRSGDLGVDPLR